MAARRVRCQACVALVLIAVALAVTVVAPRVSGAPHGGFTYTTYDVPVAGATSTSLNRISESGQIVGVYTDAGGSYHGFLLDKKGNFTTIDVPFPGVTDTLALGINNRGQIVGYYSTDNITMTCHGFLLEDGVFTTIDPPDNVCNFAWDINNRGQIAGGYTNTNGEDIAYLLEDGNYTYHEYPDPAEQGTGALGVNASGNIVGQWTTDPTGSYLPSHGYLLDKKGNFTTIDLPGFVYNYAAGINEPGDIVGTSSGPTPADSRGWLYRKGVFTMIHVPGATATGASGINNRRQIVGSYRDAAGRDHGFIAQ